VCVCACVCVCVHVCAYVIVSVFMFVSECIRLIVNVNPKRDEHMVGLP